jgi:hypothetical protein
MRLLLSLIFVAAIALPYSVRTEDSTDMTVGRASRCEIEGHQFEWMTYLTACHSWDTVRFELYTIEVVTNCNKGFDECARCGLRVPRPFTSDTTVIDSTRGICAVRGHVEDHCWEKETEFTPRRYVVDLEDQTLEIERPTSKMCRCLRCGRWYEDNAVQVCTTLVWQKPDTLPATRVPGLWK